MIIDTGLRPIFSKKSTSTQLFNPMTGPISTTLVKEVRHKRWLEAATPELQARFAYRMSNDGITWGTVTAPSSTYLSTLGWFYNDDAAIPLTTDLRLFVQLGMEGINDSGGLLEQALARLVLDVRPVFGRTLATEYQKVFTDGTTTRVFHPLFDPVPLEDVGEHRATVRLDAPSGSIDVIPAYQLSDDGITWYDGAGGGAGTFTTFGTAVTTETTTYGTSFSTESIPTGSRRRRFRYGIGAKNGSAGVAEIGLASMRVDYRRTT